MRSAENPKPVISVAENAEVNPMRYPNVLGIDLRWRSAEVVAFLVLAGPLEAPVGLEYRFRPSNLRK